MTKRTPVLALLALLVILAFAAVLRIYNLRDTPAGLFCDEAALGYNAFAIGTTGYDENGEHFPLFIWSFGGYKNPVYIYSAILPIRLFGLDEFSLRLTSALFGLGTIIVVFFLCRELFSTGVGLLAALALAVCPWHLHFSRIAFELISLPFLFSLGLLFLVRYTKGRRTLAVAFFFFGACLYAYAIAKLFVPVFLVGFGLLYIDQLLKRWRETFLAAIVLAATVAPVVHFDLTHQQGDQYFRTTSFLRPGMPLEEIARHFARNYAQFFSPVFLFQHGDEISRHAVKGHGELYPAFLPVLLLGGLVALVRRDRASKLVLLWLALYPGGASLMNEIPSATRGFIGVVPLCILAGLGAGSVLWAIAWIGRKRLIIIPLQAAALAAAGYVLVPQVLHYLDLYFNEYPKYSAPTYGGFQYGYRDLVKYMEPERGNYRQLMWTATEVNQPYIFALFYRQTDPLQFRHAQDPGYLILEPMETTRYDLSTPILYALRESELRFFSDYTVKQRIVAPGGQTEFVIAEVRARRTYLTQWLSLGLFENMEGAGLRRDEIQPSDVRKDRFTGVFGDIYWRRVQQAYLRIDLNQFYQSADKRHPGNPEYVCAYNYTSVRSPKTQSVFLELIGSDDYARIWLNGTLLTPAPLMLGDKPKRRPIDLVEGDNALLLKSCESVGDWYFAARITDNEGRDIPGIEGHADFPPETAAHKRPHTPPPPAADVQVIEGFDGIEHFGHTQNPYIDYRGGTESWWSYMGDADAQVEWRTAVVPAKKTTVAVFTASLGEEQGAADLYVNGELALSFETDDQTGLHLAERNGYRWVFVQKAMAGGNSGVVYLTVPASAVTPGKPLDLKVVFSSGPPHAWFMIKDYRDTAAHEGVTPAAAAAVGREDWKENEGT